MGDACRKLKNGKQSICQSPIIFPLLKWCMKFVEYLVYTFGYCLAWYMWLDNKTIFFSFSVKVKMSWDCMCVCYVCILVLGIIVWGRH